MGSGAEPLTCEGGSMIEVKAAEMSAALKLCAAGVDAQNESVEVRITNEVALRTQSPTVGVTARVQPSQHTAGQWTVPHARLAAAAGMLGADLTITWTPEAVRIQGAHGRATIPVGGEVLPAQRRPEGASWRCAAEDWAAIHRHVAYACSALHPNLNGIYLRIDGGRLIATATDGYRLATHSVPVADVAGQIPTGTGLPASAALAASRLSGIVTTWYGGASVEHWTPEASVLSSLYGEDFPDASTLLKGEPKTSVPVPAAALATAMRRASALADAEDPKRMHAKLRFAAGKLVITAGISRKFETEVPVFYEGPEVTVHMNPAYVADVAERAGETALVEIRSALSAVVIDDALIMPMQVG